MTGNKYKNQYNIQIDGNCLTGELVENEIKSLLVDLLQIDKSKTFKIEELPVEEAMKSFFLNPEKYIVD